MGREEGQQQGEEVTSATAILGLNTMTLPLPLAIAPAIDSLALVPSLRIRQHAEETEDMQLLRLLHLLETTRGDSTAVHLVLLLLIPCRAHLIETVQEIDIGTWTVRGRWAWIVEWIGWLRTKMVHTAAGVRIQRHHTFMLRRESVVVVNDRLP